MHEWPNSNQDAIITGGPTQQTEGTVLNLPAQVMKETVPLDPKEHLLHKAHLPRLGVTVDLPNIWKQTQRGSQHGETKKQAPNERTGEFSRKRVELKAGMQLIRYRVQSDGHKDTQQHEKGHIGRNH